MPPDSPKLVSSKGTHVIYFVANVLLYFFFLWKPLRLISMDYVGLWKHLTPRFWVSFKARQADLFQVTDSYPVADVGFEKGGFLLGGQSPPAT